MEDKFIIKTNDQVGRYVVASQNLKAGEAFLCEKPFSYGPKVYSPLICLGCHNELENLTLCSECSWPVCNDTCSQNPIHKNYECPIFKSAGIIYDENSEPELQLQCIVPLRTLLETERKKDEWEKTVGTMEHHPEHRKAQEELWTSEQNNVVQFLLIACKLRGRFSEELIQKVCGILTVNSFEIVTGSNSNMRGLYFNGALLSHNCVCNTTHSLNGDDEYTMIFRTLIDVPEGGELFSTYTLKLEPTLVRRSKLMSTKYFSCQCARCKDPTELGTHLSTLKCTKCDPGLILSTNPLDENAPWKCTDCDFGITGHGIIRVYLTMQEEIGKLEMMENTGAKLEATEKLLKHYKSVLHPNHGWNVALWQGLIQMYGRIEGYTLDMLPDILLERKANLCRQFLSILDVICPGFSRLRGMTLYELHVALLLYNRSRFEYKELKVAQFKEEMKKIADMLRETAMILGYEPETSPEGMIATAARESLIQLEQSLEQLKEENFEEKSEQK